MSDIICETLILRRLECPLNGGSQGLNLFYASAVFLHPAKLHFIALFSINFREGSAFR